MSRNRKHNSWLIVVLMVVSVAAHPAAALVFEMTRPDPVTSLRVVVTGEGGGAVQSLPTGIDCGSDCSMELSPGSLIRLRATVAEGSTFEGWTGPCGSQAYELLAWMDEVLFPLGIETGEQTGLHAFLLEASDPPLAERPLECEVSVDSSVEVIATFGVIPDVVQVALLDELPKLEEVEDDELRVSLPKRDFRPEELLNLTEEELKPEPEPEPDTPEVQVVATAAAPPPPPPVAPPPMMKSVEVPDENEVEEAPDDATFLSDKNRDVAEETRATETNLLKAQNGKSIASVKSDLESEEIGGEEAQIFDLEDIEETAEKADQKNTKALGSASGQIVRQHSGEAGEEGENGEAGDGQDAPKTPGLLSMRNPIGRGALGTSGLPEETEGGEQGEGGERGTRGTRGTRGPNLRLDQRNYERLVGKEVADREVAVAVHKKSRRRGRWERKQGMLRSALENFTPEVRPGNQTALKTRAAPFALYIARMHRGIHRRWGFGFLSDMDGKSANNPMNDMSLVTMLEIVILPNGSIDKMTIVRTSGLLTFDVAALSVIDESAPFESTPEKIRSPDGKVYMHWSFHRGPRQCGTFNARPFILSSARGSGGLDDTKLLRSSRKKRKR
ncbi:MAG: TonB C-terminal domain-containing protein [Kofleriaceae bacterium]|nr:TonB C-terminal domain-containing protein [Kofleriaceae bacterium]